MVVLPVSVKVPVPGSYSSATRSSEVVLPPTISTLPAFGPVSLSNVAVGKVRA